MIDKLTIFLGDSTDPYHNLAVELALLESVREGEMILYLWQNQNTVVIGHNQNAWKECRTTKLAGDGGHLTRRLSGGGAVFHDLGNLNFTFAVKSKDYDLDRQLSVIGEACRLFGIQAERSGRNDILAGGRKFSGNSFYSTRGSSFHNGTLLVDVDMTKLGQYLNPSKAKLASKGVDSTRSRVVNLKELAPDITIDALRDAMCAAFETVYGQKAEYRTPAQLDAARVAELEAFFRSEDWLYGRRLPFTFSCEDRFAWGGVELELQVDEGRVQDCAVYTDAMDHEIAAALRQALQGCAFSTAALCEAVGRAGLAGTVSEDIKELLKRQEL